MNHQSSLQFSYLSQTSTEDEGREVQNKIVLTGEQTEFIDIIMQNFEQFLRGIGFNYVTIKRSSEDDFSTYTYDEYRDIISELEPKPTPFYMYGVGDPGDEA
jgi:hypothetical protein